MIFKDLQIPALYDIPIALAGVCFVVVLLLSLEVGYRVGLTRRRKIHDGEAGGGGVVLTSMFALLGLILAFTYGFTVDRYNHRKEAVVIEANALGTAYLRAGLIDSADGAALQEAVRDYAKTRILSFEQWKDRESSEKLLKDSLMAQARLWPLTRRIIASGQPTPIEASLVASINDVLDRHTDRLAAVLDRLPPSVFWVLLLIASASVSVAGFNAGLSGFISRFRMTALTIVLAAVMLIIIDFDRPRRGFILVSQEPLKWSLADMKEP